MPGFEVELISFLYRHLIKQTKCVNLTREKTTTIKLQYIYICFTPYWDTFTCKLEHENQTLKFKPMQLWWNYFLHERININDRFVCPLLDCFYVFYLIEKVQLSILLLSTVSAFFSNIQKLTKIENVDFVCWIAFFIPHRCDLTASVRLT